MQTIMFSKARSELAGLLDQLARDRAPIEIVRREKSSAVLLDKEEYEGLMETLHLLSAPTNAARLLKAKTDIEQGHVLKHDMIE